jgi:transcriptional regulator with XRE-family HTH domain
METTEVQQLFFQHIKSNLPAHLSMVDEVAEVLNISNDSAYRRIRGEKVIGLEEIQKLCVHYKVSLDQFLHLKSEALIFTGRVNYESETLFEDYLESVYRNLSIINSFEKRHLYFLMKDIPPFVHFQVPELSAFKFYFWMRSILHYDSMQKVKFSIDDPLYEKYHLLSKKVIEAYNKVPTTEIWNVESINSTIRQIEFLRESGLFKNPGDVKLLYEKLEELINHIERQAETGLKFNIGTEPTKQSAPYRLFVNEFVTLDNTLLAEMNDIKLTFINHSVLYFVTTRDEQFNNAMFINLDNLMKKSTLISEVGEKERVRFFNRLRDKIQVKQRSLK